MSFGQRDRSITDRQRALPLNIKNACSLPYLNEFCQVQGGVTANHLAGKAERVCCCPHQGHGLVLGFLEFGLWITVIDNAGPCLNMKLAVTNLRSTQCDTGIEVTSGRDIADGAGIDAAACLLYTSPSPRDRQKSRMPSSA